MIVEGNRHRTMSLQTWAVVLLLSAAFLPLSAQSKSVATTQSSDDAESRFHSRTVPPRRGQGPAVGRKRGAVYFLYAAGQLGASSRCAGQWNRSVSPSIDFSNLGV